MGWIKPKKPIHATVPLNVANVTCKFIHPAQLLATFFIPKLETHVDKVLDSNLKWRMLNV
jgi:ornithine carbamoyltransferase